MDERITISFVLLFIILSFQIPSVAGDGEHVSREMKEEPPYLARIMTDQIYALKRSCSNSWDKAKTIIHDLQLQFFPPNLDFRSADQEIARSENGGGEKMKKVVEKCIGTSKRTAEITAESAADVMGVAVRRAAEKGEE
ncbi:TRANSMEMBRANE PROTEIN [Salix koriyanagi]|uniref:TRANSMEMBRANE PROTEIN n=1 Tax=Salix koriyanagi TaxID=2511006 RepID=A0A9Q0SMH9_9ROSI|nr:TRANSMEMBRANE PROTEIN [Salix koriyanagi]